MSQDREGGVILLVDDNVENLRLLSRTLAAQGHSIHATRSGLEALSSARSFPPDLILLDIGLPDLDGLEVCRRLRQDPATSDVPVLFLSALNDTQDKVRGFAAGGVDYITKPFQGDEVIARVQAHLRLRRLQRRLDAANRELLARQDALESQNARLIQAQNALKESSDRFAAVTNSAYDAIITTDESGAIVGWNAAAERIFGYPPEEVSGQSLMALVPPDSQERMRAGLGRLAAGGDARVTGNPTQVVGLRKDGREMPVDLSVTEWQTGGGRFYTAIARDITDRKLSEQRALEVALERERITLLRSFIQNASHEFRTPLTIIQSNVYLLERLADPGQRQQKLAQVGAQVTGLTRLVEQLAEMVRLDSGEPLTLQPADLNTLVEAALAKVQNAAAVKGLALGGARARGRLPILADAGRLEKALHELIDNAIRFTPAGGSIAVCTRGGGEDVSVEVRDSGPGIAPEALPRIFDRFFREDVAHTTPGFGLGLPIARAIVERHGGRIEAESRPGAGSLFRVVLPRRFEADEPVQPCATPASGRDVG